MSGLINKVLNFVGWEESEDFEADVQQETNDDSSKASFNKTPFRKNNNVVNIHSTSQVKVVIMQPENLEDAQQICDHLKNKKPVVINLEEVDRETAQRLVDFLGGALYSLDGSIQRISSGIYMIAPNNVDVMNDVKYQLWDKEEFPWIK